MVKGLKDVKGDSVMVDEEEIMQAFTELAKKGFFVEPSSAVAYAGYKKELGEETSRSGKFAIVLTGNRLKTNMNP
jgi:threonine synthase